MPRQIRLLQGPFADRLAEDTGDAPTPMLLPFDQEGRAVYSTGKGARRRKSTWIVVGPVEPFPANGAPHAVACYRNTNCAGPDGLPAFEFSHLSGFGM